MNKYQACVSFHEANGFLPAKQAEEFKENKDKLILYVQDCILSKLVRPLNPEILNLLDDSTVDHLLSTDCSDSDELEEAIQVLTDPTALEEVKGWYRRNRREH